MKKWFQRITQPCYLLAGLAGLLLAAAFPKWSVAGLAWFAPGFLLFLAMGQGRLRMLAIGWAAGMVHHLVSLYWLLYMPVPFVPILAWLALSAYCAVYTAVWVWLCWWLFPARMLPGGDTRARAERFVSVSWGQRMQWALLCAVLWVALEIILGRFLTGFPWLFLGMSQYRMIPLIQISSITGVYGVSFLVVWFSAALLSAGLALMQRPNSRWVAMAEVSLPMFAVAGVCAFGLAQSLQREEKGDTLKVTMVQPSVPQTMIWDPKESTNRFRKLVQLSEEALKSEPQLLIWPEAAVPGMLRYDAYVGDAVAELAARHKVWMIIGADDAEPRKGAGGEADYYNASFLISPDGRLQERYIKRRLVIFGEYVPLARWLPFLKFLTPIEGGFVPGDRPVPFAMSDPQVKTAVLICFEDVFPHVAREYVDEQTDFLVNLTNDGWFGESAEQWQQAANAVFRAVENGIPLLRCTNNGVTCWIDGHGRMRVFSFGDQASVYGVGHVTAQIPLLGKGQRRRLTFYTRHGDGFGFTCLGLAAALVLFRWRQNSS